MWWPALTGSRGPKSESKERKKNMDKRDREMRFVRAMFPDQFEDEETSEEVGIPIVDGPRSEAEREMLRRLERCLIASKERRLVASFLERDDYETVDESTGMLMAMALHESFPRFV